MTRTQAVRAREPRRSGVPGSLRAGIGLAFLAAAISGIAIFINGYAVKQVPDAAVYTAAKNGVAAIVLLGAALLGLGGWRRASRGTGSGLRLIDRRTGVGLLFVGIVGGGVSFLLFFVGLATASAPGAAFIQKSMFVWVALLAVPLLGERLGWAQIGAIGVLFAGQLALVPLSGVGWGSGETMIAVATLGWSLEIVVVRRLLASLPTGLVAISRMGIGLIVLVGYVAATGRLAALAGLGLAGWGWALLTGLILAGYVGTWYAALRRAPASLVTAVLVVAAPLTAALQAVSRGTIPAVSMIVANTAIVVACALLAALAFRAARAPVAAEPA